MPLNVTWSWDWFWFRGTLVIWIIRVSSIFQIVFSRMFPTRFDFVITIRNFPAGKFIIPTIPNARMTSSWVGMTKLECSFTKNSFIGIYDNFWFHGFYVRVVPLIENKVTTFSVGSVNVNNFSASFDINSISAQVNRVLPMNTYHSKNITIMNHKNFESLTLF